MPGARMRDIRLVGSRYKLPEVRKQAPILGIEVLRSIVRHHPDRSEGARARSERNQQRLEDLRAYLRQVSVVQLRVRHQLQGVAVDHHCAGTEVARRRAPEVRSQLAAQGARAEQRLALVLLDDA